MKQTILRKYARLIAKTGVNIQKGQEVIIRCDLDQPKFVELLVDECYKAGAKKVTVEFNYQRLEKLQVRHQTVTTMSKVDDWEIARLQHYADVLPCRISLASRDPDGLKGINQSKIAKSSQKRYPILKPYMDKMENKCQWCIAAVPGAAWAKKLFPELPKGKAIEKLWEAILFAARVTDDPIAAWEAHNADLRERCSYLNALVLLEVTATEDLGSYTKFICKVVDSCTISADETLTYSYYQEKIKPAPAEGEAGKPAGYVCEICGYIYEDDELPPDFTCPICKAPASRFKPL